ncbi:MAG: DUF5615 family PIN-like protein [bacterium]|nr:DUF5615 family PIN-like protein [bacterium]
MRLLLDESVPRRLRQSLPDHSVRTVMEMGWGGVKNGELLRLAASDFDAFITVDKNLQNQQNLSALPVSVVVLHALSNELHVLMPLVPDLEAALVSLQPCCLVQVGV